MICVKAVSVFLFFLFLSTPLMAAPEVSNQCKVYVAVLDEDPAGLNVRETPGGVIIGTLPGQSYFAVIEIRGKWARVADFELPAGAERKDWPKYPKQESGWVHTSLLGTSTRSLPTSFYSEPSEKSKRIIIDDEDSIDLRLFFVGCRGSWLNVRVPGKHKGPLWVKQEDTCPLAWTTCP